MEAGFFFEKIHIETWMPWFIVAGLLFKYGKYWCRLYLLILDKIYRLFILDHLFNL